MIMAAHLLHPGLPEDLAFRAVAVAAKTMAGEDTLHDMGRSA